MEKKYRLLIIDDSEETVAGLKHFFSKTYEVLTAADGMEGLKLFENEKEVAQTIKDMLEAKMQDDKEMEEKALEALTQLAVMQRENNYDE